MMHRTRNVSSCPGLATTVLAACLLATPAAAWYAPGHMISAAIAYRTLKAESPETVAMVITLLKRHPDYERRWKRRLETAKVREEDRDLCLFMLASTWADNVRRRKQYH